MSLFKRDKPIVLGEKYRDEITSFEGTATCRSEYLYGCVRILLEGKNPDGKPDELIFDEQRLTDVPSATSGGSYPAPSRSSLR